jgi:hypothetical protein
VNHWHLRLSWGCQDPQKFKNHTSHSRCWDERLETHPSLLRITTSWWRTMGHMEDQMNE